MQLVAAVSLLLDLRLFCCNTSLFWQVCLIEEQTLHLLLNS